MTRMTTMIAQMPMWQDGGHLMGLHWGWWTFWIVLLVLLVLGVASGFGGGRRGGGATPAETSAEEVLRRCFAAGEIDEEEYQRRLKALRDDGSS